MNHRKIDRRILRTRRALKDAMLGLVLEQGFDAVTIEQITHRADLGRTTFYLHYRDKEELLLESIRELIDDLVANIRVSNASPILLAFQHAAENADLYRIILRGEGAYNAVERLRKTINQTIEELFKEFLQARADVEPDRIRSSFPLEVVTNFLAGSLLGLLTWWLEERPSYTPEQMADMFRRLFLDGVRETLEIEDWRLVIED
jgi:AcrR family transcriptional regulator